MSEQLAISAMKRVRAF